MYKKLSSIVGILVVLAAILFVTPVAAASTQLTVYKYGTGTSCTGTLTQVTGTNPELLRSQCYYFVANVSDLSAHDHIYLDFNNAGTSIWVSHSWTQDTDPGTFSCTLTETSSHLKKDCDGSAGSYVVTSVGFIGVTLNSGSGGTRNAVAYAEDKPHTPVQGIHYGTVNWSYHICNAPPNPC